MKRILWSYSLLLFGLIAWGQTPTTASSGITFSNTYCNETTLTWTSGDGAARIVVASVGSPLTTLPVNNTYYLGNSQYGFGHSLEAGAHVVYNGSGYGVRVTNLQANTKYYFSIFEVNGGGTTFNYLTSTYPEENITTEYLNVDFTIDDSYQCDDVDTFQFTSSVSQSGSETINYFWKFGDGQTATTPNATHSYAADKVYNVDLTVSTTGCVASITKKDTVAETPKVSFVLDPDTPYNDQVQCFNYYGSGYNRFALKNTTPPTFVEGSGVAIADIYWDFGDGGPRVTGRTTRKTYTAPGVYRVVLYVNSRNSNRLEYCSDSAEMFVTVKPVPIDTSKIVFSDTAMCEEGNKFDFSHNHSDMTHTNTWYFGDGDSALGRSVSHSYSTFGKYYVDLHVVDTAGCLGEYHDSIEVIQQPNNEFTGLDPSYCEGDDPVQLMPLLTGGDFEGDNVDALGVFTPTQLGLNTVHYIITVGTCIDTATEQTVVNPLPVFSLQSDTSICTGTTIRLQTNKGNDLMQWSTGATDSFIDVDQDGLYWLQKTRLGCRYRDSVNVVVIDPPVVDLGVDTTLCGDGSRVINVTADEGEYVWNDGYVGPTRVITTTGYYEVTVTNKCGSASDEVNLTFLPYACDIYVPSAFSPDDNNVNDLFRPVGTVVLHQMTIYNRWGEKVYEQEGDVLEWDGTYEGEKCPQGNYFYIIWYDFPVGDGYLQMVAKGPVMLLR